MEDYNANRTASNKVFSSSVAQFMPGVSSSDVEILSVTASGGSAVQTKSTNSRALQVADGIDLLYSITIKDIFSKGFETPTAAFSFLLESYNTSVATGDLLDFVTITAAQFGAEFQNITALPPLVVGQFVENVVYAPTLLPTMSPTLDKEYSILNEGEIAGTVIAVILGTICILTVLYYYFYKIDQQRKMVNEANFGSKADVESGRSIVL